MTDDQDELSAAFDAALTGRGHVLRGVEHLIRFADFVASCDHLIRNVETYEVRGELEVPRIDLGLYQGSADDADLPRDERAGQSRLRLAEIAEDCEAEGLGFIFHVWIDSLAHDQSARQAD